VYNVFKAWLEQYYIDEDDNVLDIINEFALAEMQKVMPSASSKLIDLVNKRVTLKDQETRAL
jgi:hypothetical protein